MTFQALQLINWYIWHSVVYMKVQLVTTTRINLHIFFSISLAIVQSSQLLCRFFSGLCEINWKFYGNSCYRVEYSLSTWTEARDNCTSQNAFLVTIDDSQENDFIGTLPADSINLWIGLNDRNKENNFVWQSNSTSNYRPWMPGQPDNRFGRENCVHFNRSNKRWNDAECNITDPYVCEKGL